mmetsp:Transcript_13152/g.35424  ORF Transcript_13152/g.35424 Transcript_13152/m.35424 type:complete len:112 (+) Transcript_13152:49-384(+)
MSKDRQPFFTCTMNVLTKLDLVDKGAERSVFYINEASMMIHDEFASKALIAKIERTLSQAFIVASGETVKCYLRQSAEPQCPRTELTATAERLRAAKKRIDYEICTMLSLE